MSDIPVTVLVPLYNRAALIPETLASLGPALDAGFEVLVVDDGSSDGGPAIVARAAAERSDGRLRLISQTNAGPGAARNTGAGEARGAWLAFLDSDDLWFPWTPRHLLAAIAAQPEAVAIFPHARRFTAPDMPGLWQEDAVERHSYASYPAMYNAIRRSKTRGNVGGGCSAIRRDVFLRLGGFEPHLRGSEDTDLFFRMADLGPVLRIDAPIMIGVRAYESGTLSGNMTAVHEGLDWLLQHRWSGRYPQGPASIDPALADILEFFLRALFSARHGQAAYRLLLRRGGARILLAEGRYKVLAKLLATPVLAVVRPRNYAFGWRP